VDKPVVYRIQVRGSLPQKWSDRLGNMSITTGHSDKEGPVTNLEGALRDQAALQGVIKAIHNLRFTVISIEALDQGPGRDGEPNTSNTGEPN